MGDSAFTVIPLTPIRKVIAARMAEAKRTIPHFRVSSAIEVDALVALRGELRRSNPGRVPSITDFIVKACAGALMKVPALNVQWAEKEIHQFEAADISVVMALKDGLTTPIVRAADRKTVWEISQELQGLAARAARNELKMEEIVGGSFSVSNLGMHDVDEFDAIINAPQCAILALGSAKPRVVPGAAGGTRVATVMQATLSCDHRAIDGVMGARFLAELKRGVERPAGLVG